jgi:membrane-associated phospholipid phosphatase
LGSRPDELRSTMGRIGQPLRLLLAAFCALCLFGDFEATVATGQETSEGSTASAHEKPQDQRNSTDSDRIVSLRTLPKNILQDQKPIFLFPASLAQGNHWWPTIGVVGVTAGLIASDPYTAPPFRTTTSFNQFNRVFSSVNTAAFIAAVPATIYGVGWLHKDSYAEETALFAAESVADGFILDIPFKGITGRKQPLSYFGNGPYSDSFFHGSHSPFSSGGFYSAHSMAATAVATVIARRYRKHRWVPFVAYGLAGTISFSRITRSDHFPTDVFFGGAMGYVISRYVVLPAGN